MKTVTITQKQYDRLKFICYNDDVKFEDVLRRNIKIYKPIKEKNIIFYERYMKAKLMLEKLQVSKYNISSIQLQGKGVDRYIESIEWESGEPLTESEMDDLLHNQELHSLLIQQYFLR